MRSSSGVSASTPRNYQQSSEQRRWSTVDTPTGRSGSRARSAGGLDAGVAERIYSILVKHAGAHEGERESFVLHQSRGFESEWRFCGLLGFGGKFRRDPHSRDGERWFVDQYAENETDSSRAIIERTNQALADLQSATMHSRVEIEMAWHDVTCPEAEECRDRQLHSMGAPLVNSGVLIRFLERLGH